MKYKGTELMQAIADKKIENGAEFYDESNREKYKYENNNFIHVKYGGCNIIPLLKHTFELIEDNDEIDIQEIEELKPSIRFEEIYGFEDFSKSIDKINELTRAIKQLDKHTHCKVCKKELAVKYGVCEKCYENVNEDVR